MFGGFSYAQAAYAQQPKFDFTLPTLNITVAPDFSKISSVSGKNTTTFTFQTNETYTAYQLRSVPSTGSDVTAGNQIESGSGGSPNSDRVLNVTAAELAALGEGTYTIKIFVKDSAGNWSS